MGYSFNTIKNFFGDKNTYFYLFNIIVILLPLYTVMLLFGKNLGYEISEKQQKFISNDWVSSTIIFFSTYILSYLILTNVWVILTDWWVILRHGQWVPMFWSLIVAGSVFCMYYFRI